LKKSEANPTARESFSRFLDYHKQVHGASSFARASPGNTHPQVPIATFTNLYSSFFCLLANLTNLSKNFNFPGMVKIVKKKKTRFQAGETKKNGIQTLFLSCLLLGLDQSAA
jgi:hypothetical protein